MSQTLLPAVIPPTSKARYLSGMTALNIPAPEGTGGDWHFTGALLRPDSKFFVAGERAEAFVNTNAIFGDAGVHECSAVLRAYRANVSAGAEVYAANHYRALLDLLVEQPRRGYLLLNYLNPEDYFDSDEHLAMLKPWLDQWAACATESEMEYLLKWRDHHHL